MKDTITVCADCHGEVKQKWAGDEGLGFCQGCGAIEGPTEEWTEEEFEEKGYY